jgi:hypothetical protein
MQLIDHTARETQGWTHTGSSRGVEKRLEAKAKIGTQDIRAPSIDKKAFEAGEPELEDVVEIDASGEYLTPGTFIEARR